MQPEVMGAAIRAAREERGLSQRQLASRLEGFGLTWPAQTIQRVERDKRSLTVAELLILAAALNRSPDVLALPGQPQDRVELSGSYAVEVGRGRRWWAGAVRPPMLRGVHVEWPFPAELGDHDHAEREHSEWLTSRPRAEQARERFLTRHPEVAVLLHAVDRLREHTEKSAFAHETGEAEQVRAVADSLMRVSDAARAALVALAAEDRELLTAGTEIAESDRAFIREWLERLPREESE
jgi:transcriptional regulator with XRE-family HTH domain